MRVDGRRGLRGWITVHRHHPEMWAFVANRITALVLLGYLYLHLVVLSLLARGPSSWDAFLSLARRPAFIVVDLVLFLAVLWHALNGVRVAAVGSGIVVRRERALLGWLAAIGALVLALAAVLLIGEG